MVNLKGLAEKNGLIQISIMVDGQRLRPSAPYKSKWDADENGDAHGPNVKYWAKRRQEINAGDVDFTEEFPEYRFMKRVAPQIAAEGEKTLADIVAEFRKDFENKIADGERAQSTLDAMVRNLNNYWLAEQDNKGRAVLNLGKRPFFKITLEELGKRAESINDFRKAPGRTPKKNYNNILTDMKSVFNFGYRFKPLQNPALGLRCKEIFDADRPEIGVYSIAHAEAIIAKGRELHGELTSLWDEFRFFTALRPNEQVALTLADWNVEEGLLVVSKGVVDGKAKNRTKTNGKRIIALSERAQAVLRRLLVIRKEFKLAGKLGDHNRLFFREWDGQPWHDVQVQGNRWNDTLAALKAEGLDVERHDPYNARHSCVTWRLSIGDNPVVVSQESGHSLDTMQKHYAGVLFKKQAEIAALKQAFAARPVELRKAA